MDHLTKRIEERGKRLEHRSKKDAERNWKKNNQSPTEKKIDEILLSSIGDTRAECGAGGSRDITMSIEDVKRMEVLFKEAKGTIDQDRKTQNKYNRLVNRVLKGLPKPAGQEEIALVGLGKDEGELVGLAGELHDKVAKKLGEGRENASGGIENYAYRVKELFLTLEGVKPADKYDLLTDTGKKILNWRTVGLVEFGYEDAMPEVLLTQVKTEMAEQQNRGGGFLNNCNSIDYLTLAAYFRTKYGGADESRMTATLALLMCRTVNQRNYLKENPLVEEYYWVAGEVDPLRLTGCKLTTPKLIQGLSMALRKKPIMSMPQLAIPAPGTKNLDFCRAVLQDLVRGVMPYVEEADQADLRRMLQVSSTALRLFNPRQCSAILNWRKKPSQVRTTGKGKWIFDVKQRTLRPSRDDDRELNQDIEWKGMTDGKDGEDKEESDQTGSDVE